MSSLFDVPAQLALVLSLAASSAGGKAPATPVNVGLTPLASLATIAPEAAQGPFRFSEGIWYRTLKEDGSVSSDIAVSIFRTSGGRYYVPAEAERARILRKRLDNALAERVARTFAERNALRMQTMKLAPTAGDLYIAHLFGPEAAMNFIERVARAPDKAAAAQLPEIATVAPGLFKERDITVAQLYERLTRTVATHARAAAMAATAATARAARVMKPTLPEMLRRGAGQPAADARAGPDIAAAGGQAQ